MKKDFILVATGFLGYTLLLELLKNVYFGYVLCRKNSKRISRLKGLKNIDVLETDLSMVTEILGIEHCGIFLI